MPSKLSLSTKPQSLSLDIYYKPIENSYRAGITRKWTYHSGENSTGIPVVTVAAHPYGIYWVIGFSIIIHVLFMSLSKTKERISAAREKKKGNGATKSVSIMLFLISFFFFAADNLISMFVGGNKVIVGHAALANPSYFYYPNYFPYVGGNNWTYIYNALRPFMEPVIQQSLARQAIAQDTLKEIGKVKVESLPNGFDYIYNITGYDMGLTNAVGLRYDVSGTCSFDNRTFMKFYSYDTPDGTQHYDVYKLLKGRGTNLEFDYYVPLDRAEYSAPSALAYSINPPPNGSYIIDNQVHPRFTFTIIPYTAWRRSPSNAQDPSDPWYATESDPGGALFGSDGPNSDQYRIQRKRLPLRCIQNDTWSYGGVTVDNVNDLKTITNLPLSEFFRDKVFGQEFGRPVIITILNFFPLGALQSTAFYDPINGWVNATRCNITDDFERLVQTAFVYSRDLVRNTALLFPTISNKLQILSNLADSYDYQERAKMADFWIETSDVTTLDFRILVAAPLLCVFFGVIFAIVFIVTKEEKDDGGSAGGGKSP